MSRILMIWKYQLLSFVRNKQIIGTLVILCVAALFALRYGKHFVQQQNSIIYTADTTESNNRQMWIERFSNPHVLSGSQAGPSTQTVGNETGRLIPDATKKAAIEPDQRNLIAQQRNAVTNAKRTDALSQTRKPIQRKTISDSSNRLAQTVGLTSQRTQSPATGIGVSQFIPSQPPAIRQLGPSLFSGELAVYRPSPFAALAIGQKDNFPFYQRVSPASNVYNVQSSDIQNPLKQLTGNFDLSYVLVYLVPLLIIVLGHSVLAEEKEYGTFTLLGLHTAVGSVVIQKLVFRMLLITLVVLGLNSAGFIMNDVSWKDHAAQMISWQLAAVLYIFFWSAVVYCIVSLQKPASVSALLLSGIWILLLLVLPSVIHKTIVRPQEKEQVQSIFLDRGDLETPAKLPPQVLEDSIKKLKHPYPLVAVNDTGRLGQQYRRFLTQELRVRFDQRISRRPYEQQMDEYRKTVQFNWINPAYAAQNTFNQIAGTEINSYHHFLQSLEKHLTQKRYFNYNWTLSEKQFELKDSVLIPKFNYHLPLVSATNVLGLMLPVVCLAVFLIILGTYRMKNLL